MAIALGFGWLVWHRANKAWAAVIASSALIWILGRLFASPAEVGIGIMLICFSVLGLFASLTMSDDSDLTVIDGGYPKFLFLLPVRTVALAIWPMLFSALILLSGWMVISLVGLYPRYGWDAVAVPAFGLIALLSAIQAVSWNPISLPLLRSIVTVVVFGMLVAWGAIGSALHVAPKVVEMGYLASTGLAIVVALRGLQVSRTGSFAERSWLPKKLTALKNEKKLLPLKTAMEAQVWYECRTNGLVLRLLGCFLVFIFIPPLLRPSPVPMTFLGYTFEMSLVCYLVPIVLLNFMSGFDGCCGSPASNFNKDFSIALFLGSRALSDSQIIESKLRMAVRVIRDCWTVLLIGPVLFLFGRVEYQGVSTTFGALVAAHLTFRGVALSLIALGCLFFSTWRATVSAMWLRLSDNSWIRNGVTVLSFAYLALIMYGGSRVYENPRLILSFFEIGPAVLLCVCGFKVALALFIVSWVRRLRLLNDDVILRWAAVSVIAGILLFLSLIWLLPPNLVPTAQLAAGIFLMIPMVRIPSAILTLHYNRHR